NAPMIIDIFHNEDFIFNCDYQFKDRYDAQEQFFTEGQERTQVGRGTYWETNFIADVANAMIDSHKWKTAGGGFTGFEVSGNTMVGHLVEWPVGRYAKAHYHGAGAVLVILRSEGYTIMWPNELGINPTRRGTEARWSRWTGSRGVSLARRRAGFTSTLISVRKRRVN
ncbi:MAG: hypothetical protein QF619_12640, partial [Candidatus Binatia bacterium]|nr:hypothetical protein [Candidatus Binatia bacterium]